MPFFDNPEDEDYRPGRAAARDSDDEVELLFDRSELHGLKQAAAGGAPKAAAKRPADSSSAAPIHKRAKPAPGRPAAKAPTADALQPPHEVLRSYLNAKRAAQPTANPDTEVRSKAQEQLSAALEKAVDEMREEGHREELPASAGDVARAVELQMFRTFGE